MRKKMEIDKIETRIMGALPRITSGIGPTKLPRYCRPEVINDVMVLAALAKYACSLRTVLDEVSKGCTDWMDDDKLRGRVINVLSWGDGL